MDKPEKRNQTKLDCSGFQSAGTEVISLLQLLIQTEPNHTSTRVIPLKMLNGESQVSSELP